MGEANELIRRAIDEGRLLGRDASPADVNAVAERLCACLPAALRGVDEMADEQSPAVAKAMARFHSELAAVKKRESFPGCPWCKTGRMSVEINGKSLCDRCDESSTNKGGER